MVCELDYMNICLPPIIEFATPLYLSGVHIEMDFLKIYLIYYD